MKQEFSYFEKDGYYFPLAEVKLGTGNNQLTIKALIDSGASFSVFRSEIAQELGIVLEKGKKIYLTGIGGRICRNNFFLPFIISFWEKEKKLIIDDRK